MTSDSEEDCKRSQSELRVYVATSFTTTKDPLPTNTTNINTKVGISMQYPDNSDKDHSEFVVNELSTNQKAELYGIKRVLELNLDEDFDLIIITRSQYAVSSIAKLVSTHTEQDNTLEISKKVANKDIIETIVSLIRNRKDSKRVTMIKLADKRDRNSSISHKIASDIIKKYSTDI